MEGVELYMLGEMDVVCQFFCNANQQQKSWANESPDQQQNHRTPNANQEQHRRNSNGPLFQAALHCNIEHINLLEGVELYKLGEMDVVCPFCGVLDLSLKRGMDKYLLENYAAMEIKLLLCQFCGAIRFKPEKRNGQISFGKLCCNGNKTMSILWGYWIQAQKEEWTNIFWKIMLQLK